MIFVKDFNVTVNKQCQINILSGEGAIERIDDADAAT